MRPIISQILFLLTALLGSNGIAETIKADHVNVRVISSEREITNKMTLGIHFEMEPEWHIYWKNPGDSGAAPKFSFEAATLRQTRWPYPERIPVSSLTNYGYSKEVVIFLDVENLESGDVLDLEWLVCKVECIPGFGKIKLSNESVYFEKELFQNFQERIPQTFTQEIRFQKSTKELFEFDLTLENLSGNLFVFPVDGGRFQTKAPQIQVDGKVLKIAVPVSENSTRDLRSAASFTVVFEEGQGNQSAVDFEVVPTAEAKSFVLALLFAFLGGLILNLMPCVFPVLFLKGYSFLKTNDPVRIRYSSYFYTLGVITTFLAVGGLLLLLRQAGESIGWGFQLQNPYFVGFLIVLFVFMALSFLDVIDLNHLVLPASWQTKLEKSFSGDFATGILAVVVASPCTAPFMGTALGLTLLFPAYQSLLIFLFLGMGLALPVPLLAHFRWLVEKLPRSGGWMVSVKKFLALPLFATSLWLGWILVQQVGPVNKNSGNWNSFDAQTIEEKKKSQSVFIDFTASWCITCQVNKRAVLDTEEIQALFRQNKVYLVRADWTNHDEQITKALKRYQRNSVPVYVFFNKETGQEVLLSEILVKDDIRNLFQTGGSQ